MRSQVCQQCHPGSDTLMKAIELKVLVWRVIARSGCSSAVRARRPLLLEVGEVACPMAPNIRLCCAVVIGR